MLRLILCSIGIIFYCSILEAQPINPVHVNPIITDLPRSFQSFGAVGDGVADDTIAVSTALNSGIPLTCRGSFVINSLITVTNVNIDLKGGGNESCVLILNSTQSMIYATLTQSGSQEY